MMDHSERSRGWRGPWAAVGLSIAVWAGGAAGVAAGTRQETAAVVPGNLPSSTTSAVLQVQRAIEAVEAIEPAGDGGAVSAALDGLAAAVTGAMASPGEGAGESGGLARWQALSEIISGARRDWGESLRLEASIRSTPQRVEELRRMLAAPPVAAAPVFAATAAEAQSLLEAAESELASRKQELEQKQLQLSQRPARKMELESSVTALRQASNAPSAAGGAESAAADPRADVERRVQRLALRMQLRRGEGAVAHHVAIGELTTLERDRLQREVLEQEGVVAEGQRQAAAARRSEIRQQATAAHRNAVAAHPAVRSLADHGARLVESREELQKKIDAADEELRGLQGTLETVRQNRRNLESRVAVAGMNRTVGLLMRQHKQQLPKISASRRRVEEIEAELPPLQLTRLEVEDQRRKLADVHAVVREKLEQIAAEQQVEITVDLQAAVRERVTDLKTLSDDLIRDLDQYIELLSQIDAASRELVQTTRAFQYFVEKHVLWIRSAEPLGLSDLQRSVEACVRAVWRSEPLVAGRRAPLLTLGMLIAAFAGLGVWGRLRLRGVLQRVSGPAARSRTRRWAAMAQVVALTLVDAAVLPVGLLFVAQSLPALAGGHPSAATLAAALVAVVPFAAIGCGLSSMTLAGGVAELHLGWSRGVAAAIRRSLRLYLFGVLPLRMAGVYFDGFEEGAWAGSAGRVMFILSQLLLFACLSLAVRQVRGAVSGEGNRWGWWARTGRWGWTALASAPVAWAALSLIGYHYSATELAHRFGWTIWLALVAASAVSLARQIAWTIGERVALRRSWQRHAAGAGEEASDDFDPRRAHQQIGRLAEGFALAGVLISTYFLWAQVLPAVRILDRVELWSSTVQVAETVEDPAGGEAVTRLAPQRRTVTLADLGLACVLGVLTWLLSRNLPGLVEMTLLDRLPLDRGGKYAIRVVLGHVVGIVGIIAVCRMLGLQWSSVQWLVAAMSVGLGFGLQEIFGNFVSGIIILLERPLRVGDLVTVNGTTGVVTRMQLRATTITDFDRRELVVPNKRFITDDVVNWTLTDPITRLVLPVGVAYGTDARRACERLLEVARRNPHVLREPPPTAVFVRFGASSLDLELRVFLPNRERFPDVQHDLHVAIDEAFRTEQIEIAFPQQDVHIRSLPAVPRGAVAAEGPARAA